MTQSRPVFVVFVMLALSVSFVIPAEDFAETDYDESETLLLVKTSTFLLAVPVLCAAAPIVRPPGSSLRIGSLKGATTQRLGQWIGSLSPISESLTILDRSLRC